MSKAAVKAKSAIKFDHMAWVKTRKLKRPGRNPMMTGFCNQGHCEGMRPKNYRGVPLKTCPFWDTCPCRCHFEQDEMFEMIGEERRLVENPEYRPDRGKFVMPDPLEVRRAEATRRIGPIENREKVELTDDALLAGEVFAATPSGQRARGQLEYQVLAAVNKAMDIWPDELEITPKRISEYIANREKMLPPSSGAIDAVWKRWQKMGFAEIGAKPVRFLKFADIERPTADDLERAKLATKRTIKREAAEAGRSFRRK